jgi:ribosome maturation factor RimP
MTKKNITEIVREILAEYLPAHGYELWNVEYGKVGKDYNLNVFIDSPTGIGTDDCEQVSRYLEGVLDERDVIAGAYYLIVSSPGMDRPLLTDAHYKRYEGVPVDVSLYRGLDGMKRYSGVLKERTEDAVILVVTDKGKEEEISLPRELVSKVRLQVIF